MENNPFNPAFGAKPERFLGRNQIKIQLINALDNPNSPYRSSLITGIRGSGKTTLLNDAGQDIKQRNKVITVSISPTEDFLRTLLSLVYMRLPMNVQTELDKIAGFSVGGLGVTVGVTKGASPEYTNNFRYQMENSLRILQKHGYKLVILFDEIQKVTIELRTFIASYQMFLQEGYPIWLFMAGLPHAVADTLNDEILSFLRRAKRITLPTIPVEMVYLDYRRAFNNLDDKIVQVAANYTQGFPYLIQLVGYYLWDALEESGVNAEETLEEAKLQAKLIFKQDVLGAAYQDCSEVDQQFLLSLASFEIDEIAVTDANKKFGVGKSDGYFGRYRDRLLKTGLIKKPNYGYLAFNMPFLREFLLEQVY